MKTKANKGTAVEFSARVTLCRERAIVINGRTLTPDPTRAYIECFLSHAFPVVTVDGSAIHPQVVANSYRSMEHQVFDLGHLIVDYNPKENPRDRVLGSVVEVELSPPDRAAPGRVTDSKAEAIGIRAVCVVHKQLERAEQILETGITDKIHWTVSMEQNYFTETSGFLVRSEDPITLSQHKGSAEDDLLALGWTYVAWADAEPGLLKCFDPEKTKVTSKFRGQDVVFLCGGLNGTVHYKGIGITPLGKEKEAFISQFLASGMALAEIEDALVPGVIQPFRNLLRIAECGLRNG
jgi:hypothetical protein